jgi:hypothetical protein
MTGFAMQFVQLSAQPGPSIGHILGPQSPCAGVGGLGGSGIGLCDYCGGTVNPTAALRD